MANDEAKLFVAGLSDGMSEEVVKQLFEGTGGTVVNVSLPKDRTTGRPRGFGFVTLASAKEAQAARDALDGSLQHGRSISVRPFQAEPPKRDGMGPASGPGGPGPRGRPQPNPPDRTLYVGNLPYDCTQQDLEQFVNTAAGQEGAVVRVHLPTDPDGRRRGFGFVSLASAEVTQTALAAMKEADMKGRRLVVNLAQPKGDRPPRSDSFSPGGFGGGAPFGGGGGFMGGGAGGPPPQRRTFDDRRRRGAGTEGGGGGEGPPAGKKRRDREERFSRDDWRSGDDE